jgi:hypothetical protein
MNVFDRLILAIIVNLMVYYPSENLDTVFQVLSRYIEEKQKKTKNRDVKG